MLETEISAIAEAGTLLGGAMLVIRANALAIERQTGAPPYHPDGADGERGMEIGRLAARRYLDTVEPELTGALADVDRLANLATALSRIAAGQPRDNVRANLRAVVDTIAHLRARAEDGGARLVALSRESREGAARLARLVHLLAEDAAAQTEPLRALRRDLDAIDSEIAGRMAAIAGAFTQAGLTIAVAPLVALPAEEDGAPVALMAAALLSPAMAEQQASLRELLARKRDLLGDETRLPPEVRFAQGLAGNIALLDMALTTGTQQVQMLAERWRAAATHVDNLDRALANGVVLAAPVAAGADDDSRRRGERAIRAMMAIPVVPGTDTLDALIARSGPDARPL